MSTLVAALAAAAVTVAVLMTATALVARRVGRLAVVDVVWGAGFVLVALVAAVVATLVDAGGGGTVAQRLLVVLLVAVWVDASRGTSARGRTGCSGRARRRRRTPATRS